MCIECIITWIVIPSAVTYGLYIWIVKKCYTHYKQIGETYTTLEGKYERCEELYSTKLQQLEADIKDVKVFKSHVSVCQAKVQAVIHSEEDFIKKADKVLDGYDVRLKKLEGGKE